jgi:deoxycytidylate deaminase
MIQAGVKRLVYSEKYRNESGINFLNENNIETCFSPVKSEVFAKPTELLEKKPKHPEWLV